MKFNSKQVRIDGTHHPVTSYISLCPPRIIFGDYSYIFRIWSKHGPTFSSFSNLPTCKKTGPQRKKDAHVPSLHISLLSTCHFLYAIYNMCFSFFLKKQTLLLHYCHMLIILCISDSNMGTPKLLLLFQNRTLISKL